MTSMTEHYMPEYCTCVNGIDKFSCECGEGFTGKFCEKALICDKCDLQGTQHCNQQTAECVCLSTHKGEFCQTLTNPCNSKPCFNQGKESLFHY